MKLNISPKEKDLILVCKLVTSMPFQTLLGGKCTYELVQCLPEHEGRHLRPDELVHMKDEENEDMTAAKEAWCTTSEIQPTENRGFVCDCKDAGSSGPVYGN